MKLIKYLQRFPKNPGLKTTLVAAVLATVSITATNELIASTDFNEVMPARTAGQNAFQIEIDREKRKKQVQEIVETDFFQNLVNRAQTLREKKQEQS